MNSIPVLCVCIPRPIGTLIKQEGLLSCCASCPSVVPCCSMHVLCSLACTHPRRVSNGTVHGAELDRATQLQSPSCNLPLASNFKNQTQREGQKQDTSLTSISCLLQLQRMTMENALSITQEMPDRLEIRTRRRHSHACRGARAHSLQRRQNLPFWGNMLLPIGHTRIRRRPPTCIVCLASGSSC